jgi:hypothetical protein
MLNWWRKKFGPIYKELQNFLPKKTVITLVRSQKYGFEIRDPEKPYSESRIQGSKRHQIHVNIDDKNPWKSEAKKSAVFDSVKNPPKVVYPYSSFEWGIYGWNAVKYDLSRICPHLIGVYLQTTCVLTRLGTVEQLRILFSKHLTREDKVPYRTILRGKRKKFYIQHATDHTCKG